MPALPHDNVIIREADPVLDLPWSKPRSHLHNTLLSVFTVTDIYNGSIKDSLSITWHSSRTVEQMREITGLHNPSNICLVAVTTEGEGLGWASFRQLAWDFECWRQCAHLLQFYII